MNNLKEIRLMQKLTTQELSELTNINRSTITRLENGQTALNDQYIKIFCDFFDVSADYLLGLPSKSVFYNDGTFKSVKIIKVVNDSNPNDINDNFSGYLPAKVDTPDNYYYLEVKSDAMSPTYLIGDYLLIKYQNTANNNDVVVAGFKGQGASVKRYIKIGLDMFLFADNESYEPTKLIKEDDPFIAGVVKGYFRPKI